MSNIARRNVGPTALAEAKPHASAFSTPLPTWLDGWKPLDRLPAGARAEAEACIPALEAALQPATRHGMGVALGRLMDWIEDFGITAMPEDPAARREKVARLSARYREHLAALPDDLLMRCVDETLASHRYRNLPLPADMIARISGELGRRRTALGACRLALKLNRFDAPPVAAADRVRPEQARKLRQEIAKGAAARAMPGADTPEYGEPRPPADPRRDRNTAA